MTTPASRSRRKGRAPAGTGRTARVFWSGRSQAVRLPREFRFDVEEVAIWREGERIVLEPVSIPRDANGWPLALWELAGAAPDFDVGDRAEPHERGDVLAGVRRSRP